MSKKIILSVEQKKKMKQPFTKNRCPTTIQLIPGQIYAYCRCGLSNTQPFCDNSHEGSPFKPLLFTAKNQKLSLLCLCKHNDINAGPYCDGSHSNINW